MKRVNLKSFGLRFVIIIALAALCALLLTTAGRAAVNDTFTDTNGINLTAHTGESGATWTAATISTGTAAISGNRAHADAGLFNIYFTSGAQGSADYSVFARIHVFSLQAGSSAGSVGRWTDASQDGYILLYDVDGAQWTIFSSVSGSFGALGSFSQVLTVGNDYDIELRMVGTSIKAIVNGVERISVTNSAVSAAGKLGMWLNSPTTSSSGLHIDRISDSSFFVALSSGTASWTSATNAAINLSATAASGGTAPYTYQWHRSTTSGFTPGGGNALSGATSLTLSDTTAAASTNYFYKLVSTDSATATVTSNQVAGRLWGATIKVGFIGDSITNGHLVTTKPGTLTGATLSTQAFRPVTVVNQGVDASATGDWINGSSNLNTAETALAAASVTHVMVTLGANDANNGVSAATYLSNLTSCVNRLVALGYRAVLNYPPGTGTSGNIDQAELGVLASYCPQIDTLINGTTILRGDTSAFPYFAAKTSELNADAVHLTDTGNQRLAEFWGIALERVIVGRGINGSSILGLP